MLIESKGDGHVIKEDFPNAIKSMVKISLTGCDFNI